MGLNSVLHKLAELTGANKSHPIHAEIDDTVAAGKDDEKDEEGSTDA